MSDLAFDHIPEDELIVVPDGEYQLSYQNHATCKFMGRSLKLKVVFRIFDFGEHYGKPVVAYYNLDRIIGKPRKNGLFSAGWRSRFMFEYATCFGRPARRDRFAMRNFQKYLVRGKVATVTHNQGQEEYPDSLKYSVVRKLLGKVEI